MKKKSWEKIANEYVVSLFPLFMLPIGMVQATKKWTGVPVPIAAKIEDDAVDWLSKMDVWKMSHQKFIKKIKSNPRILREIYRQMEQICASLIRFCKKEIKNLDKASNQKLLKLYQAYVKQNTEVYGLGLVLPILDYQQTTFLSDEVKTILKKRGKENLFAVLTTPTKKTFNKKQEISLLKLAAKIKQNKKTLKLFNSKEPKDIVLELSKKHKQVYSLLKSHTQQYNWIYYVYEGPAADIGYFTEVIKDLFARKIDPEKELENQTLEEKQEQERAKTAETKLNLNFYEKQILALTRDAVFLKPYRREMQSWSYYLVEPLLKEIARRKSLGLSQVRMMLPEDIKKLLTKNSVNLEVLNQRSKFVVYGVAGSAFCHTGKKALNFMATQVVKEKIDKKAKKFLGTVAFRGKVKGKVKIINYPKDMGKMNRGDILVSDATNPNLMPAIRIAKAIVTNEGGLTCHAAIVSRELHIPCVVGTGTASRVLKDGDLVEVDANKGIARKL